MLKSNIHRGLLCSILILGIPACSVVGIRTTKEPSYRSVAKLAEIVEVREYDHMVWAQVAHEGESSSRDQENNNFRKLFKYIQGNNRTSIEAGEGESKEIPMTAPVFMSLDKSSMSFVLPKGTSVGKAPIPLDSSVELRSISPTKVAVLRFSGSLESDIIAEKAKQLLASLEGTPYKPLGELVVAGYDPPWTLPALRRNEVMVEVEETLGK